VGICCFVTAVPCQNDNASCVSASERTSAAGAQANVGGLHARVHGRRRLIPQPRHDAGRMVLHQHRILPAGAAADIVCGNRQMVYLFVSNRNCFGASEPQIGMMQGVWYCASTACSPPALPPTSSADKRHYISDYDSDLYL